VSYGPAVGPDGNIFVVAGDLAPPGAVFSLTPAGALRWESPVGVVPTVAFSQPVFGPAPGGGQQMVYAAGNHLARVDTDSGDLETFADGTALRVVMGATGNIYHIGRGYSPSGDLMFIELGVIQAAAPDGSVYASTGLALKRLDGTDGSTIWSLPGQTGGGVISVSPDHSVLLYTGSGNAYQPPAKLRCATTDGAFLWNQDLPVDDGRVSAMATRAVFTPDSSIAYFGSTTLFQGPTPACYLYAVSIAGVVAGDLNGDGVVGFADVLAVIGAWGSCPSACPEDLDGDGVVGFSDVLMIIANWTS